MSDTSETADSRVGRRTLLGLLGSAAVGSVVWSGQGAASEPPFVLEQAGRCVPLQPLSAGVSVEEFYDYRAPFTVPSAPGYSSYGTVDLQRPETSILFLYEGPRGTSLVIIHDKLNDGTPGGSVSFDITGLSASGEWVVRDDDYDEPSSFDVWDVRATESRIDWTWGSGRSDGGVFSPLDATTPVTIVPAFNEQAALAGEFYDGEITEWQALSGSVENPERISLSLTEPVTIRAGTCDDVATRRTTTRRTTKRPTEQPTKRPTQPEPTRTKTSQPTTKQPTQQPTTKQPTTVPRDDHGERKEEKREREEEKRERKAEREEEKREREEERRERKEEREEERREREEERKEEKEDEDDD